MTDLGLMSLPIFYNLQIYNINFKLQNLFEFALLFGRYKGEIDTNIN